MEIVIQWRKLTFGVCVQGVKTWLVSMVFPAVGIG